MYEYWEGKNVESEVFSCVWALRGNESKLSELKTKMKVNIRVHTNTCGIYSILKGSRLIFLFLFLSSLHILWTFSFYHSSVLTLASSVCTFRRERMYYRIAELLTRRLGRWIFQVAPPFLLPVCKRQMTLDWYIVYTASHTTSKVVLSCRRRRSFSSHPPPSSFYFFTSFARLRKVLWKMDAKITVRRCMVC